MAFDIIIKERKKDILISLNHDGLCEPIMISYHKDQPKNRRKAPEHFYYYNLTHTYLTMDMNLYFAHLREIWMGIYKRDHNRFKGSCVSYFSHY